MTHLAKKQPTIDHHYTDEAVCPHCGHEHSDTWEWQDGKHECAECEQPFELERHVEATYSTEKWVDPVEDHRQRLARERAKLKPPDLSFRYGPPPIAPRAGHLAIHDTTFGIWDEDVDDGMKQVLRHVLAVLHAQGFEVVRDPETEERHPSIANDYWRGRRGDLRFRVSLGGRHVEVMGYQELNLSNPNGGEYDFGKYQRMPRAMQLACTATLTVLARELGKHGYGWKKPGIVGRPVAGRPLALFVRDEMLGHRRAERRTPLEAFNERWGWDRFGERDENGFMAEKEYRSWNGGRDGDGVVMRAGDTRYFYEGGRLMRGTVYPDANGSWMVAAGGVYLQVQQAQLFDCDPTRTRRRYVPGQPARVHKELAAAVEKKDYPRAAVLASVLERMQ